VGQPIGTSAAAEFGGRVVSLRQAQEADRQFEFSHSIDFDPSLAGPWNITAFNGNNVAKATSNTIVANNIIAFVRNTSLTSNDLTPTLNWEIPPVQDGLFDRVQISLFDDTSDERLSVFGTGQDQLFANLAADASGFTFAPGLLEFGKQYVARVVLTDLDDTSGDVVNRSVSFFNFTPIAGQSIDPIFLPNVDAEGTFNFDFDVDAATPIKWDPFVAVGYDFEIGIGDPLFTSISLPNTGNGIYDLFLFDTNGTAFDSGLDLVAGAEFDFTTLALVGGVDYATGATRFSIRGI